MTPDFGKRTGREPWGQAFGVVGGRNAGPGMMELSDPRTASGEEDRRIGVRTAGIVGI